MREGLGTQVAVVGLLACVDAHMRHQMVLPCKALAAVCTVKGALSGMSSLVALQVGVASCSVAAHKALEPLSSLLQSLLRQWAVCATSCNRA